MKGTCVGASLAGLLLLVTGGGCGTNGPTKTAPEILPETTLQPAPSKTKVEAGDVVVAPSRGEPAVSDDYLMSYRDCDLLSKTYARAWEHDELVVLDSKGLAGDKRAEVAAQLHQTALEAGEQYYGQCENTVGSAWLHSRLKCAHNAKTMQRFNDCLDGKIDGNAAQ